MALVRYDRLHRREGARADRRADPWLLRPHRVLRRPARPRPGADRSGARIPSPVIVRMSDFKTNEYANLLGGAAFEPHEENPMLGFRGASRYYSPRYRDGFALECRAIRRLREEIGLRNVIVMIPFCRTLGRGRPGARGDGRERPRARRERARGLRDVRDPVQRDPGPRVRARGSTASRSAPTTSPSSRSASTATRATGASSSTSRTRRSSWMIAHVIAARARAGRQGRPVRPGAERPPGVRRVPGRAAASTRSRSLRTASSAWAAGAGRGGAARRFGLSQRAVRRLPLLKAAGA